MKRLAAIFLALCCSIAPSASTAQVTTATTSATDSPAAAFARLPAPNAVYRDPDPAVAGAADPSWKPYNAQHMKKARLAAQGPVGTVRDATRYAFLLSLKGETSAATAELQKAASRFPHDPTLLWSTGWIQLHLQDYRAALVAWQEAEDRHGGRPYWVPYSKAIALIGLNDIEAAVQWWQVAQRDQSPALDTRAAAFRQFSYWRPAERRLLRRLLAHVPARSP